MYGRIQNVKAYAGETYRLKGMCFHEHKDSYKRCFFNHAGKNAGSVLMIHQGAAKIEVTDK